LEYLKGDIHFEVAVALIRKVNLDHG